MSDVWAQIEAEARDAYRGAGKFPLRAYSERMPPPYVGWKPATGASQYKGNALEIDEYEQAHDLEPGFDYIGQHLVTELSRLVRGEAHALSKTLLEDNPAWPAELAAAAKAGKLKHDPLVVICNLALSRTQDDKGNVPWTLFGASHAGPKVELDEQALIEWAGLGNKQTLVTFTPFSELPADVRARYLAGELILLPTPAALILYFHPRYKQLDLPRAMQIPLQHLFPRVETSCAIRIPQSGWLDESDPETGLSPHHQHRVVTHVTRTHRWQRVARDAGIHGDGMYTDKVSVALFATTPEAVDLYDKPLARNAQIWTHDYELLLDGQHASIEQLRKAAGIVDAGGRFGYRMYYPPMRAGLRDLYWHVPVIAKPGARFTGPTGYVTAERDGETSWRMEPHLLARESYAASARLFERDPGLSRHTTCINIHKLLEARDLLGTVDKALARSLVHIPKTETLDQWIHELPQRARNKDRGKHLAHELEGMLAADADCGAPIVIAELGTREFEEKVWTSIASLAHGEFRQKNDADGIRTNKGKSGGPAAKKAHVHWHERCDLVALGDHLHARYRALGAESFDHVFRWETDFEFPWMEGWLKNQQAPAERNIVCVIPGKNRGEAIIMGDHYDTAYMEDVFYAESGGDSLRAPACGADDNHSATTLLLLAAEKLLPLSRAGKLERDVWLVHLTGEEFPADCMGARALGQAIVEGSLRFTGQDGKLNDMSKTRVVGAFVADMIGHNADRDRDVFQIASGEGPGSARLARNAHRANQRWNKLAAEWNRAGDRAHADRAVRVAYQPGQPPPAPPALFAHLPLHGEVRVEWEPRSALFNTDGQIFSDLGVPVVLFMENYDISRKGYHDTHDTMENIDLDYCAALTAIAIETLAETACAPDAP